MSTAMLPKIGDTGFAVQDFARPPEPASIPFTMPPVSPGQIVLFYPNCNPGVAPVPCAVIEVQPRRITVASLANRLPVTDGWVRHAGDPLTIKKEERENGCWNYVARDRELFSMMQAMRHLQQCILAIAKELDVALPAPEASAELPSAQPQRRQDPTPPGMTAEEAKAAQQALLDQLDNEPIQELETENEPLAPGERVRMRA
jgi:hypothetical protein